MEAEFWHRKWAANDIGFHEPEPHPMLLRQWPALDLPAGSRVFVPLCGKSNDMLWLRAQGHAVVGVELSAIAVEAFFADNGMTPTVRACPPFVVYEAPGYTLWCGDCLALTPALLGEFAALYDRAALIALPPDLRADYAATVTSLAPAGARMLLVTVGYAADAIRPPPFLVEPAEVSRLYAPAWSITTLGQAAAEVKGQPATETAFRLDRRRGD
jgi:thiopurine S-methyltransferase